MESHCSYSDSRFKAPSDETSNCYSSKKMGCCIIVSVALLIAILSPTITYIVYNESNINQEAQQLLQVKQAEENNYLLQIQNLEDKVKIKQETEQRLSASLMAQLEKSKGELKTQEVKYENQIESLQEKYDKQLGALQIKLNVQIEQNRVYYAQIVQLHNDHLKEIVTMLNEFKETQTSFDDVENYVKKSKDKLQVRWDLLNKEKDKIAATLKKINSTATDTFLKRN